MVTLKNQSSTAVFFFISPEKKNNKQTLFVFVFSLTLLWLNMSCPVLANSADPDQLASEEANWSGSALFVIKYVNFHQKPWSSNLIGWKLEEGMAPKFIQHDKG